MVDDVKPGMSATVRLPDRILIGDVFSLASVTQPASWFTGNVAKCDAIIQLLQAVEGLKPGMTAEVEIQMARYEDVLMIPIAAVVETDEGHFCWVGTREDAKRRSLQLGDGNDEFIIVESGLQEGEQVVLNPAAAFRERPVGALDG